MFDFLLNFILLLASLAALVLIADKLIDHSIKLAKILGVSGAAIGLTLLAYGSSMPEFAVSTIASYQSHDELSVSNITGSNIYNVAIIMGIVALLAPFYFKKEDMRRDGMFMIASTLVLILFGFLGGISLPAGVAMVIALVLFTYYVIENDKKKQAGNAKVRHRGSARNEILWCCLYLLGVLVAGTFTVEFAVNSAKLAGISEWIIGSTIVAAGTSMPETVISIVSARKKQMGMSIGNIIGSNYFNVFWILGASAIIKPLAFSIANIWVDLVFLGVITALFYAAIAKRGISRWEGVLYIAVYIAFLLHLLRLLPI